MTSHIAPAPWEIASQRAPRREPLFAGLWRHRQAILAHWPNLPLPTYVPAQTAPFYLPVEAVLARGVPVNSGKPAGPGPFAPAAALVLLWERWSFLGGGCPECDGDIPAYFFGGIMHVGSVSGLCIDCGRTGSRFLPGFPFAVAATAALLAGTPWTLPWTPLAFRLGGKAPGLRAVLSELGVRDLSDDSLLEEAIDPVTIPAPPLEDGDQSGSGR